MRIVPKRSNHLGTGLKKTLDILGEGIGFLTLDIDAANLPVSGLIEDSGHGKLGTKQGDYVLAFALP
jgi:hypothetical protein